jgi:hypothetical protein
MSVSISCARCSALVRPADAACASCGRQLTSDERTALEARLESSNADYRDARAAVTRALTVALVVGLMTLTLSVLRLVLELASDIDVAATTPIAAVFGDLVVGCILVICFFAGRRFAVPSLAAASTVWFVTLLGSVAVDPSRAILRFASPAGVALALAKLMFLLVLARALPSGLRLKRLLKDSSA